LGLKNELIQYSKLCGAGGFVKAYDGNLSVRTKKNYILSTASKTNKSKIKPADIVKSDIKGKKLAGKRQLSTEIKLHLYIYSKRKDVNAVIHTHPIYISSFAAAGKKLPGNILPEVYLEFGNIPMAPYATPSTDEVSALIEPFVMEHNAIILGNHGLVAFGKTLEEAYYITEKLEQYAQICLNAKVLGGAKTISPAQLKKLDALKNTVYKSK
jgi:L-fuculose-phosphate aldolase